MRDESWRAGYDAWKTTDPADQWTDGEDEPGCTCPRTLGAGGARMVDEWCPVHGRDPDEAYEQMRDDRDG